MEVSRRQFGQLAAGALGASGLRLWVAAEEDAGGAGLGPELTLPEFFERWYLPVVLEGERGARQATVDLYRQALAWWRKLVGPAPLAAIEPRVLAEFAVGLRAAQFRRGLAGPARRLSLVTQAKVLRHVRAVLARTGPTRNERFPCAELLPRTLYLASPAPPKLAPKPCFDVADARRIVAATAEAVWPGRQGRCYLEPPPVPAPAWWSALLHVLYYTGLRVGTALALEWSMVQIDAGGVARLDIPAEAVSKVHRGCVQRLHPAALAALERIRTDEPRLLPWPYHRTHLGRTHQRLCVAAGLPPERRLSLHAWRRTHGQEMARVGAKLGVELAQRSLQHASAAITLGSYVRIDELVERLPPLVEAAGDDGRQRRLFE